MRDIQAAIIVSSFTLVVRLVVGVVSLATGTVGAQEVAEPTIGEAAQRGQVEEGFARGEPNQDMEGTAL